MSLVMTTPTVAVVLSSVVFLAWRLHRFLRRVEGTMDATASTVRALAAAGVATLERAEGAMDATVTSVRALADAGAATLERVDLVAASGIATLEHVDGLVPSGRAVLERVEALTADADASVRALVPEVRADLADVKGIGELVLRDTRQLVHNMNDLVETLELKRCFAGSAKSKVAKMFCFSPAAK
jgi:uncharacterized protein YoxC